MFIDTVEISVVILGFLPSRRSLRRRYSAGRMVIARVWQWPRCDCVANRVAGFGLFARRTLLVFLGLALLLDAQLGLVVARFFVAGVARWWLLDSVPPVQLTFEMMMAAQLGGEGSSFSLKS